MAEQREGPEARHLVIGANGGVGRALVKRLHGQGARCFLAGRNEEALASLAAEVDAPWARVAAEDFEQVEGLCARAREELGGLDAVTNLAGSIALRPAHLVREADLEEVLRQNLFSAFASVRGAAKAMKEGGSVVLVSSVAASVGLTNHEAIAAAKAGVEGLVRASAATYQGRGLRINAIAPGLMRTPMAAGLLKTEALEKASAEMHPLGRVGEPEEAAALIAFLHGPDATWMTGQVVGLDGGLGRVKARPARR